MNQFSRRLGQRMQQRIADTRTMSAEKPPRFDLVLWDHEISGPHEARILIGFNSSLGVPKKTELDEWLIKTSAAQMRVVPESVRLHPEYALIVAEAIKIPQVRPMAHTAMMIAVTADTFMDEKDALWEVRKTSEGNQFLARIEREDIDSLLKEREKMTKSASVSTRPRLAHLKDEGIVEVTIGDHITYLKQGKVFRGQVKAIFADRVKVALSDKEEEVMKPDILDVTETTEDFKAKHKQELINIFTQIYGDRAFASELVNL